MADILQEFIIKAPRESVFEAMATPLGWICWWTKSASGEAKESAEYALSFGPGDDWRGNVTRYVPGSAFELHLTQAHLDWMGTRLGCHLEPESQTVTRVRFYHPGWPEENEHWRTSYYCWAMYLRLLRRYLEHSEIVAYEKRLDVFCSDSNSGRRFWVDRGSRKLTVGNRPWPSETGQGALWRFCNS